jgi:hypothetical protein
MCMILDGFGFTSISDKSTVTLDDEKRVKIEDTVKGYKRLMKTGQKANVVVDCIKVAVAITGQQWGVKPEQVGKKGKKAKQYTLEPCGDGLHWGTPTWERHTAYQDFETNINTPPSKTDDNQHQTYKGIAGLFRSMKEKRKRETEADGNYDLPKKTPA